MVNGNFAIAKLHFPAGTDGFYCLRGGILMAAQRAFSISSIVANTELHTLRKRIKITGMGGVCNESGIDRHRQ